MKKVLFMPVILAGLVLGYSAYSSELDTAINTAKKSCSEASLLIGNTMQYGINGLLILSGVATVGSGVATGVGIAKKIIIAMTLTHMTVKR